MSNYKLGLLFLSLLGSIGALAQPSSIKGVVSDANNQPIANASVSLRKAHTTTKTDARGAFSLALTSGSDTLVITHVNYVSRYLPVSADQSAILQIRLDPNPATLEVLEVSTGYQTLPKERATGSFVQINRELLDRRVSTNIIDRLLGVASGVSFNKYYMGGDEIQVRGRSTILSNTNPLIILDNFPYDGDLASINPNDISSITILKDAAAASIWGSQAGNGVIVLTTKKGHYNKPVTVQLNANHTISAMPDLYQYPNIPTADWVELERYLFNKGAYDYAISNTFDYPALSPVVETLVKHRNQELTDPEMEQILTSYGTRDIRDQFLKYAYHRPHDQQYALNVNGGSERFNYYVSAGWDKNSGALKQSSQRITVRSENVFRPVPNLELNTGIIYTQSDNRSGRYPTYGPAGQYAYESLADEAGKPLTIAQQYRGSFLEERQQKGYLEGGYRPLEESRLNRTTTNLKDIRLTTGLRYGWRGGLSVEVNYQYEKQYTDGQDYHDGESYFTRDLVNRFTQADPVTGMVVNQPLPPGAILDVSASRLTVQTGRAQVNFNRSWKKHTVDAIGGLELRQVENNSHQYRVYGYNAATLAYKPVNLDSIFTIFPFGWEGIPPGLGFAELLDRYRSVFANAAYTYLGKYTLSASGRIDASNYFGVATNQRAVPLWSAGLKWNISREPFMGTSAPHLALRLTYGFSGNVNKRLTAYTTAVNSTSSTFSKGSYALITTPGNSSLRWEKTGMLNLGIDFRLWNGAVSGNIDYYVKKGTDLIGKSPLDPTVGFLESGATPQFSGNVANMKGSGYDLDITTRNIDRKIKWTSNWLLSFNTSKITSYGVPASTARDYITAKSIIVPVVGREVYAVYSYRWNGLDPQAGDPIGYVKGEASKDYTAIVNAPVDELKYHGSARPRQFGALRNTVTYRQFSVSANIIYKLNYFFMRPSINYTGVFSSKMGHADYDKRWQKPGDERVTNVPSLIYPELNSNRSTFYTNSEVLVEKGDHIRLQDIRLSYQIPVRLTARPAFKSASIYLYANNVGILWKANKQGIDPDYYYDIPAPRTVSIGFTTQF